MNLIELGCGNYNLSALFIDVRSLRFDLYRRIDEEDPLALLLEVNRWEDEPMQSLPSGESLTVTCFMVMQLYGDHSFE